MKVHHAEIKKFSRLGGSSKYQNMPNPLKISFNSPENATLIILLNMQPGSVYEISHGNKYTAVRSTYFYRIILDKKAIAKFYYDTRLIHRVSDYHLTTVKPGDHVIEIQCRFDGYDREMTWKLGSKMTVLEVPN